MVGDNSESETAPKTTSMTNMREKIPCWMKSDKHENYTRMKNI